MAVSYKAILWNRQKRIYDWILLWSILLYIILFVVFQLLFHPEITPETMIIRATGTLGFFMLHIILMIGPLSRLSTRFLPLLYNRRHFGVSMFLIALVHSIFNIIQFHVLGDVHPILSVFVSNTDYFSLAQFPFHTLGFIALIILFLMAATSHDFWLNMLSPFVWKSLHMLVYVAYVLLVLHVMLGVIQRESAPLNIFILGMGVLLVTGVHIASGIKGIVRRTSEEKDGEGYYLFCSLDDIPEDRAKVGIINGENIAVFKYQDKLSAINNVCKHQNGPLGEGKIIDGCVTCPWHGYQYRPEDGASPPPFKEKVSTYDLKLIHKQVWVNPVPFEPGTYREPTVISTKS